MNQSPNNLVNVVLPLPIFSTFYYSIDTASQPFAGVVRVKVPFGNKEKTGLLINRVEQGVDGLDQTKLKPVHKVLDEHSLFSNSFMPFLHWIADYYFQPIGEVCFLALPSYLKKGLPSKTTKQDSWSLAKDFDEPLLAIEKKAPKQYALLQCLKNSAQAVSEAQLNAELKGWRPTMKAVQAKGWVTKDQAECFDHAFNTVKPFTLNDEQQAVAEAIQQDMSQFQVHLIDGITGSGKTEVYFSVMQKVIDNGQQILFMLPEIGLTHAFIKRIGQRFGNQIAVMHSGKTEWKRYVAWDQAKRGAANIVIATRSGVFVDFANLGLIVIDEEHDSSYRQEDGVYYHGRDCAIKRAQMLKIPVVMGSATPSLETLKNCSEGHYLRHELNQRAQQSQLADLRIVNTHDKVLHAGCSQMLKQAISAHLEQKGQVVLFLNRRGFAPILMCHACGWRKKCEQCEVPMSLHRSVNQMVCHHCAKHDVIPQQCESCGSEDIQHYGIGTQQLEEQMKHWFADVPVTRIDRDSTRSQQDFIQKMALLQSSEPGIFIGTQMLAKGHDFSGITLVGILNVDQGLYSTQYRATERLAQTVIQVAGRAGRGKKAGQVLLQTDFPEHELMPDLVAQNYRQISQNLLAERKLLSLPPFSKVITFRSEAQTLEQAEAILMAIKECIDAQQVAINCIGPFPAYLKKQQGRYRAQMHCNSADLKVLRQTLKQLLPKLLRLKKPVTTQWRIDVDPVDL